MRCNKSKKRGRKTETLRKKIRKIKKERERKKAVGDENKTKTSS